MTDFHLKTPVAFFIFNRPDTTKKVFEEIRRAKPPKLLVVADGPRSDNSDDAEKCKETRDIIKSVDWPCDVLTNYSDVNLGCRKRISSGIDWVFNIVEEAIILEDDCLPHPTFFRFCEELLIRYRHNPEVSMISGDNFQSGIKRTKHSYYFQKYTHIWGWATWRRAWNYYDVDIKLWPSLRDKKWLNDVLHNKDAIKHRIQIFENTYQGKIDTWDYQWTFACWIQGGLCIVPETNLISNIGFDPAATHTKENNRFSNIKTVPINFPLSHPSSILCNNIADKFTEKNFFGIRSQNQKTLDKIISVLKRFIVGIRHLF